jgi:hypothetical protein
VFEACSSVAGLAGVIRASLDVTRLRGSRSEVRVWPDLCAFARILSLTIVSRPRRCLKPGLFGHAVDGASVPPCGGQHVSACRARAGLAGQCSECEDREKGQPGVRSCPLRETLKSVKLDCWRFRFLGSERVKVDFDQEPRLSKQGLETKREGFPRV